ncbi:DUF2789 domain-containing protein [Shewanella sedimentimangrovi]|uniref:DUF2789 domain-containing protein n=1 Tax=Shewanella sedimentimangrovi TaxID=2814293 RepID=A0ABX7R4T0_9GAMM|nr:DUF2789 domain-containing protein [Shewanella sedimentimangrovi]QSX38287.1 DUF2789 domain-containing protein [Shewanella sedimentimangrovi]
MDTTPTDMSHLFEQLGLPHQTSAINNFIDSHSVDDGVAIWQAKFWSPAQASFLREALDADAQWSELIDQLDTMLRK